MGWRQVVARAGMVVWVVQRGFAEAGRFGWLFQRAALAVFGARKAASIVLLCDEWIDVRVHGAGFFSAGSVLPGDVGSMFWRLTGVRRFCVTIGPSS